MSDLSGERQAPENGVRETHTRTRTYVTSADPNLRCDTCGEPVSSYWYDDNTNRPCGHVGTTCACPSWSPVDGCRCDGHPHQDSVVPPGSVRESGGDR